MTVQIEIADNMWLKVRGSFYPGTQGRYYGPPERCYEAEDPAFIHTGADLIILLDGKEHDIIAQNELIALYYDDIFKEAEKQHRKGFYED